MASGWGCQHLTAKGDEKEWCKLLKKKCKPNMKGCILHGRFTFSEPKLVEDETRKLKKRSDNPLG
jgi:hypothetical protein